MNKNADRSEELDSGVEVSLFQSNEFRNLLHLRLFYHRATDDEARSWLNHKNVIQSAIVNELFLEVERLDEQNQNDMHTISQQQNKIGAMKRQHREFVDQMEQDFEQKYQELGFRLTKERDDVISQNASEVAELKNQYEKQIQELTSKLDDTENKLNAQVQITVKLDKDASVSTNVLENKSIQIDELRSEVESLSGDLNKMTESYNRKDKEAMSLALKRDELQALNKQAKDAKDKAERENVMLKVQKEDLSVKVETLRGQIDVGTKTKQGLESNVRQLQVQLENEKNKKRSLKDDKKQLKKEIERLEQLISDKEDRNQRLDAEIST